MRALLLFNPNATTTDDRVRDVIASALSSEVRLDVEATKQRGHATHLSAGAIHEGYEAIFVLGGDGTANEVVQACAGTGVLLGVLPGGSTNVFVRALGLPGDAVACTAVLLDHLRGRTTRSVNIGMAGSRYFAMHAGYGFDAAVVRLIEQRSRLKRVAPQWGLVLSAFQEWLGNRYWRNAPVTLSFPGEPDRQRYGVTIVGNADPYTYLSSRPMRATPQASFDTGLDLLGITKPNTPRLLRMVAQTFGAGTHISNKHVDYFHDLDSFVLRGDEPLPLMVDGDYGGEHASVTFQSVRDGLRVLA